jgi:serine/threonine protein phosphatase PrpC
MEGIGLISLLAAASFAGAGVVRLYPALIEHLCQGTAEPDAGICQTTGNKEVQADLARVVSTNAGRLAVLADGIGKKNTGQVCAQIAMDTILDQYEPYQVLNNPNYLFKTAFYEANRRIQATLGERWGGVSLGVAFMNQTHLYYALAGNIRIALFRHGELIPLSKGQTLDVLAEEAWKEGKISRQEAVWSMEEHRMWNYLGMNGFHEIELCSRPIQLKPKDTVFMATSGIFEELSWSEMEDILAGPGSLQERADAMICAAERKESVQKENGSVIIF